MKDKECYKVLDISENADSEEIETAYKKLKKKYNNNTKKLEELKKAYENLTKEENEEVKEDSILSKITKEQVLIFCGGLILGLLIMLLFYPSRIAKLENGEEIAVIVGKEKITADDIYTKMKEKFAINTLVDVVDNQILSGKYKLTEEDYKTIESTAKSYISNSGMEEEEFYSYANFENKEEFLKYLELDYLRNKYYQEYVLNSITEGEVKDYYENSVYGAVNTEHILVKVGDYSESEAKAKAQEILDKLNAGTSWDEVKNEYSSVITVENFKTEFDSPLEESFKKEVESLSDGARSKSLVQTTYGFHIVYRKSSEEKASMDSLKNRIKEQISTIKQEEDKNLYAKTLIKMREEEGMDIKDTEIKKQYEKYAKELEEVN